jgi:hypothetical protein
MEPATSTCSTVVSDQSACIRSIDTPASSATSTNTDDFEMGVLQIEIVLDIEVLIGGKSQNQRFRMN